MDPLLEGIQSAVEELGAGEVPTSPEAPGAAELSKRVPLQEEEGGTETLGEQSDVPTEYWGVSLEGIEPERRAALIAHFEQQDSTIHQLQDRLAKASNETPAPEPKEREEVSDEDLLSAMGFDPDDWQTKELAPHLLPLARTVLALEDQVSDLTENSQVQAAQTFWNSELDTLEGQYGPLPGDREAVLRFAAKEGIASPYEAYFKLSAPIKSEIEKAANTARREAAREANSGQLKPRSSAAGQEPVTPGMSLRDAVAAAAKSAEEETGRSWKGIFGGRS